MNFGINSTPCSEDGKIALDCSLWNALLFPLELVKFIPKFTPSRAYIYSIIRLFHVEYKIPKAEECIYFRNSTLEGNSKLKEIALLHHAQY